jgi:pimeloyl-ACP methyl ester carboxylesterase
MAGMREGLWHDPRNLSLEDTRDIWHGGNCAAPEGITRGSAETGSSRSSARPRISEDEKIARNIPGATLKYFPHSGHWPFQEEQAAYVAYMRGFMASVETDDLRDC